MNLGLPGQKVLLKLGAPPALPGLYQAPGDPELMKTHSHLGHVPSYRLHP